MKTPWVVWSTKKWTAVGTGAAVSLLIIGVAAGCSLGSEPEVEAAPASTVDVTPTPDDGVAVAPGIVRVVVTAVVDGDTIEVSLGGARETVRVIGIDAPEREECGYAEATQALSDRVLNQQVNLTAITSRDDTDQYGRLLRYVSIDHGGIGDDVGLMMISDGWAVARYDSRDGYGRHPLEATYIRADEAAAQFSCSQGAGVDELTLATLVEPRMKMDGSVDTARHR